MGHAGPVDRLLTSCGLVLARRSPPLGIPFRPPLPWRQADVAAACAALGDLSTAEEVVARLHHMSGAARTGVLSTLLMCSGRTTLFSSVLTPPPPAETFFLSD